MELLLLFIIILLIIFWPAIRSILAINRVRRRFNDMQRRAAEEAHREQQRREARRSRPRPRKVFGRDEGEYVEFEEIDASSTTYTQADGTSSRGSRRGRTEQQVSDAEWEEIKTEKK